MSRSPQSTARLAGLFYLITSLTGGFAELFVRGRVFFPTDAVATAHSILASEPFYRLGFVADIIGGVAYTVVTLLLYELLRPVSRSLSLLAAFFSLVGIAIGGIDALGHLAPLLLLKGAPYLKVFNTGQLQAMALLALKLHAQGYLICLVFFGFYELMLGYLIFRSNFLPRALGVLVSIAGLAFVTNSLTAFLAPSLAHILSVYMLALDGIGEISLMLWLLVLGVNVAKWEQRAHATSAS
ncbi:MAG TPA: DUF4386 domain-containing protein [Candidatus Babeliales bacterium]|nr:DUF4386 domain-containing protein [Candidatus Babeliales bacterium]